ncbi:MAG TPA: TolC family protein, partial [bacterium]|nr:TolC family protein [bacterium]
MRKSFLRHAMTISALCLAPALAWADADPAAPSSAAPLSPAAAAGALTWSLAVQTALQHSPTLAAAKQGVDAADQAVALADADLMPTVNAVAGINRSQSTALGGATSTAGSGVSSSYSGGLQANWTLFNGFSSLYGHAKARQQLAGAKAAYASASATLLLNLRQAFNQLLYDQKNAALLQAIADRYHQDTLYQQLEFQSGQTARWTFLKSQSDEAQVKWDLEQNDLSTQADRANLAALLGRDPAQAADLAVIGELAAGAPPADDGADWAKVQAGPAVLQQQAAVAADDAALGVSDASLYPSLSAAGFYTYSGGDTWGPDERLLGGSLNLSFNLFGGGANLAAIRLARATLEGDRQNLQNLLLNQRSGLRKAWATYFGAFDRVPMAQLATTAGEERFKTVG